MDFDLSDELIAVRDLAREFAEKEIAPTAAKDDKEKNFSRRSGQENGRARILWHDDSGELMAATDWAFSPWC